MTLSTKIDVFYGFYICSQWAFIHALLSRVPFALAGLSCIPLRWRVLRSANEVEFAEQLRSACTARDASPDRRNRLYTDVIVSVMTSLIAKTDCHWLRRPDHVTCTRQCLLQCSGLLRCLSVVVNLFDLRFVRLCNVT